MHIIQIGTYATDISGIVKDSLYVENDDHLKEPHFYQYIRDTKITLCTLEAVYSVLCKRTIQHLVVSHVQGNISSPVEDVNRNGDTPGPSTSTQIGCPFRANTHVKSGIQHSSSKVV